MLLNIIPNLPHIHQELVETIKTPDGVRYQMHPSWHQFFSQLNSALQKNFSNEGIIIPNQSTANINLLTNKNFAFFGDNQLHVLKVILNGVVKTITTS
jgi:hypothetical protein